MLPKMSTRRQHFFMLHTGFWFCFGFFSLWFYFWLILIFYLASLVAQKVMNLPAVQETRVQPLGQEDPWRREWQPTPVFLPGESHGQRSLLGCSPRRLQRVGQDRATNAFTSAVLNIVSSAALNIGEQISPYIMIFYGSEACQI